MKRAWNVSWPSRMCPCIFHWLSAQPMSLDAWLQPWFRGSWVHFYQPCTLRQFQVQTLEKGTVWTDLWFGHKYYTTSSSRFRLFLGASMKLLNERHEPRTMRWWWPYMVERWFQALFIRASRNRLPTWSIILYPELTAAYILYNQANSMIFGC